MKWITRARPKIDRIACPWLITRFIDDAPEFLYVPAGDVMRIATDTGATPYDVPDVELGHHGEQCSFDAFIDKFKLRDPALDKLALIVRAADTGAPELAKESEGLLAISRGLSMNFEDDHQMLAHGMVIYDALYAICAKAPLTKSGKVLGVASERLPSSGLANPMPSVSVAELAKWRDRGHAFLLLDVRRAQALAASGVQIAGAHWKDPALWLDWKDGISRDQPVVVYCAHGHEISQGLTATLKAMEVDARHLEGGIAAWLEQGQPVAAVQEQVPAA